MCTKSYTNKFLKNLGKPFSNKVTLPILTPRDECSKKIYLHKWNNAIGSKKELYPLPISTKLRLFYKEFQIFKSEKKER